MGVRGREDGRERMGQDIEKSGARGRDLVAEQVQWAKLVAESDIIPDAYRHKPANILVAVGFGQAMGLSYADSLYRINVILGKPTMSGELIASQVRRAGHKLRIYKDEQHQSVKATIHRKDDPDFEFSAVRDKAWAERMGLTGKDNYIKQPMTMLMWRAVTAVAREACPEALYGVTYTPDEPEDQAADAAGGTPVEDAGVVDPAPTLEQCKRISDILLKAGVQGPEQAAQVLQALSGRPDVRRTDDLRLDEAEAWLGEPDLLADRVRRIIAPDGQDQPASAAGPQTGEAPDAAA